MDELQVQPDDDKASEAIILTPALLVLLLLLRLMMRVGGVVEGKQPATAPRRAWDTADGREPDRQTALASEAQARSNKRLPLGRNYKD